MTTSTQTRAPARQGWVPTSSDFGARLALVRQHMGWGNVTEAAIACGQPVSSWRNWERDGRRPRDYMAVCRQIAERTGCDLGWLAGLEVHVDLTVTSDDGRVTNTCSPSLAWVNGEKIITLEPGLRAAS